MTSAAQISQIHLIHDRTGARTVIHIGSSVRGSDREIVLEGALPAGASSIPGSPPLDNLKLIKLRFTQVNPRDFDAPVVVELVSGTVELAVDGKGSKPLGVTPGLEGAPLNNGSVLQLDDQKFQCEIHTQGRLPPPRLQTAWKTVIGPVQGHNEDAIGVYPHHRAQLFVIADGVGGAEAGERVSEFAVKWMLMAFHYYLKNREDDEFEWQSMLATAFHTINHEVRHFSRLSAAPAGTTLIAMVLQGWDAYIAHVGDSRLYQYNGYQLRQVTADHVKYYSEKGVRGTVRRAMLMKGIGKEDDIAPDIFAMRLQPDDRLIFVSDGVYNTIPHEDLTALVKNSSITSLPDRIIEEANARYNSDNLSVIAVRAMAPAPGASRPQREKVRAQTAMPRVYVGYDRRWRVRLKASEELATRPDAGLRYAIRRGVRKAFTRRNVTRALIVAALVLFVGVPGVWLVDRFTPDAAALLPTPTRTFFNTPVRTPSPVPTATAQPTETSTPMFTPVTPTVTLPPLPTITLPPGFGN